MANLDLDASLNLGGLHLEAIAGLKASVDAVKVRLDKLMALEEDYQQRGPIQLALRAGAVSPSSGDFGMGLGGPKYGRLWEIRRLVIGGANFSSTVGGTAEIYVTAVPSLASVNGRNISDMVDQAPSLPLPAFYSSGQIVIRHPQELHVVIHSPTATTQYSVNGGGFDIPDGPVRSFVAE